MEFYRKKCALYLLIMVHRIPLKYIRRKLRSEQIDPFLKAFKERFGEEEVSYLWVVRSDNPVAAGYCSISEDVTNLIVTLYYILNGYVVRGDIGSGPDLIAFKGKILEKLRKEGLIRKGGIIRELLLSYAFGRVKGKYKPVEEERVVAIESESWNPEQGVSQLKSWTTTWWYEHGFSGKPLDQVVVAAPFYHETLDDVDVLTYDSDGIKFYPCRNENFAKKHQDDRSEGLRYLEKLLRDALRPYIPMKEVLDVSTLADLPWDKAFEKFDSAYEAMDIETLIDVFIRQIEEHQSPTLPFREDGRCKAIGKQKGI